MVPPRVVSIEFGLQRSRQGVTRPVGGSDYDLVPLTQVIPLSANLPRSSYVKLIFEGNAILWGYAGFAYADVPRVNIPSSRTLSFWTRDSTRREAKKMGRSGRYLRRHDPVFRDGRNELLYQVGALIHLLSNGQQSVPVTARFRDVSDLFHFTIDGTYSDPQTRGEIPVELIVDTQTYSIVAMTSIVATENGIAISDISPRPEGIFRPSLLKFGTDGNMRVVSGEGIRWSEGLDVIMEMIPAGKTLRILGQAESIGGAGAAMVSPPVTIAENPR